MEFAVRDKDLSIFDLARKDGIIGIKLKTHEEYKNLLKYYEITDVCWESGTKATELDYYNESSPFNILHLNYKVDKNIYTITHGPISKNTYLYSDFPEIQKYLDNNIKGDLYPRIIMHKTGLDIREPSDDIWVSAPTICKSEIKEKENDEMKILDLYKEKQVKLIEQKYDKQIEELEKNDELQVYLEQVTDTVKEILNLKKEDDLRIGVATPYIQFTQVTIDRKEEIVKLIKEEKLALKEKIEEIEALLELAPNYEEKMQILRDYGIIDKKKNIVL